MIFFPQACKSERAASVTAVLPCLPYSRSDRGELGSCAAAQIVVDLIKTAGTDRIITVDLHSTKIAANSPLPVDNVYAESVLIEWLKNNLSAEKLSTACVVSPDAGGSQRAKRFAQW